MKEPHVPDPCGIVLSTHISLTITIQWFRVIIFLQLHHLLAVMAEVKAKLQCSQFALIGIMMLGCKW